MSDAQTASPDDRWPAHLTAVIGREVARRRANLKMKAQELADRCADLGHPIARSTIAKLEAAGTRLEKSLLPGGEPLDPKRVLRTFVTVQELVVLAEALEVPPVLLLSPVDQETAEVLPGREVPAWEGVEWLTGERDMRDSVTADFSRMMLSEYREYVRLLRQYRTLLTEGPRDPTDVAADLAYRLRLQATSALIDKRRHQLAEFFGIDNPSVPADLEYLLKVD